MYKDAYNPWSASYVSKGILKSVGEIWSDFFVLVNILEAALWITCNLLIVLLGRPVKMEVQ